MRRVTPSGKGWHPGQLIKSTPFGIILRRSQLVVSGQLAAHLEATNQAIPLTGELMKVRPAIALSQPIGNFAPEKPLIEEKSDEPEEPLTTEVEETEPKPLSVDGKIVTSSEKESLVKFFNDPSKRSVALSINYVGSKTMDGLEAKRPLTWETLIDTLSQTQVESSIKWLRSHPTYQ